MPDTPDTQTDAATEAEAAGHTVRIYGADDNMEVEGDIREELYVLSLLDDGSGGDPDDGFVVAFSDGTAIRVRLAKGVWRFSPIALGQARLKITQAVERNGECTDIAVLTGYPVKWVMAGPAAAAVFAED